MGDAGARMDAYNDLERVSVIAVADVSRVRFWYVRCDDHFHTEHLNLVEGLLQRRLKLRLSDVENAVAAPGAMPDDLPDRWENDFSGLDPSHRDILTDLLGAEPMTLGLLTGHAA